MLSCNEIEEALSARLDGELPADRAAVVDAHLAACAACRELAEGLAAVDRFLLSEPLLEADPRFVQRVRERLDGAPARVVKLPLPPPRRTWAWRGAGALAAALLVMGVFAARRPGEPPAPVAVASVRAPVTVAAASVKAPAVALVRAPVVPAEPRALRSELVAMGEEIRALDAKVQTFKARTAAEARGKHAYATRSFEIWK